MKLSVTKTLFTAAAVLLTAPASATDFTWSAGGGLWSDVGFWSPVALPGGPTVNDRVFVTNNALIETITITQTVGAESITLTDGGVTQIADSIILNNGVDFTFGGSGFLNDGHFQQNSSGADTFVQFSGSQVVAGRGDWVMSDNFNNRIIGSGVLQHGNGFGHEIRGAGQLLANTMGLWNLSTIRQQGTNALTIDPNVNGVDNDGLLIAEGAGGLTLTSGTFDNSGGSIQAATGSVTRLNSATFIGGSFATTGSGQLQASASTFNGIVNNGSFVQLNGNDTTIINGLTNNGSWSLNSTGSDTFMQFSGSQTLGGVGEVVMSNNSNNRIIGSGVLTIGNQQILRGAGQLAANTISIINNGTIRATENTELLIDANVNGFDQNGILRAEGSGGIRLTSSTYRLNNAVELMTDSRLLIDSSTVTGSIDVAAGERVELRTNTLQAITVNGDTRQDNSFDNTFTGGLTNNGSWSLNSTGSDTFMQFSGSQTLGGVGEVVMSNNSNNRIIGSGVLTIGNQQILRGAGQLGANTIAVINEGSILATENTELLIDANVNGFDQNGILRAEGVGGIRLTSSTYRLNNAVELMTGSRLLIDSSTVTGSIDVAAGERVELRTNTLQAITVNGDTRQDNSFDNTFTGGLTNNGSWSLNSTGSDTFMQFSGSQTLGGVGEVVMSNNSNNRIIGSGVLTIGNQQILRGAGQLGANTISIINEGSILATENTELLIDANVSQFENRGTVNVTGAGGLRNIGDFIQTAGQTVVNSTMTLQGGELELMGGTLSGDGNIAGSVNNPGGSVNAGNSPGTLTVTGDYVQSGAGELLIEIAGTTPGLFDVLLVNGTATLGGTLGVNLLGTPAISVGQVFDVLEASLIVGLFDNSQVSGGGGLFDIDIIDGATDIVRLTVVTAPVPLPAAVWLLLSAVVALGARRRKS